MNRQERRRCAAALTLGHLPEPEDLRKLIATLEANPGRRAKTAEKELLAYVSEWLSAMGENSLIKRTATVCDVTSDVVKKARARHGEWARHQIRNDIENTDLSYEHPIDGCWSTLNTLIKLAHDEENGA